MRGRDKGGDGNSMLNFIAFITGVQLTLCKRLPTSHLLVSRSRVSLTVDLSYEFCASFVINQLFLVVIFHL